MLPTCIRNLILDYAASMEEFQRRCIVHEELESRNLETVFRVFFFSSHLSASIPSALSRYATSFSLTFEDGRVPLSQHSLLVP